MKRVSKRSEDTLVRIQETTSADFTNQFNINTQTARRYLSAYADLGLVVPVGNARTRIYRTKLNG